MPGYLDIGSASLQALSCHRESLIEIKLRMSEIESVSKLLLLKSCTNLVSLSLSRLFPVRNDEGLDSPVHIDEKLNRDTLLETVAWLKECKNLRSLAFEDSLIYSTLVTPILSENGIHLTSLRCLGRKVGDTKAFYKALANQTSLKSLWLKGYKDNSTQEVEILVESLTQLVNLKDLQLAQVTNLFVNQHIVQLVSNLPKLEVWSMIGPMNLTAIWDEAASLRSLRILELGELESATIDEILNLINNLGPGNKGLQLVLPGIPQ